MRNSLPTSSYSTLPKITSQYIEDLIRQRKKPCILIKQYVHTTQKKRNKKISEQRINRLTESLHHTESRELNSLFMSQHLDIRSPFYKRISNKNFDRCKCRCAHKSGELPTITKVDCSHHNQIAMQKNQNMKDFHQSIVANIKENHQKIHQVIEKNNSTYIQWSIEKLTKIKHQKALLSEINRSQIKNKIAKASKDAQQQKELAKTVLRERLEKMYSLDDENQPFEKILLQRDRWQVKRKKWAKQLTLNIQAKILQINKKKQKAQKENPTKKIRDPTDEQNLFSDLENCLVIILKNISSISDLLPKFQTKEVKEKINDILRKNLNNEAPHYLKKLRKKLGDIIEQICVQKSEIQKSEMKQGIKKNKKNIVLELQTQNPDQRDSINISPNEKPQQQKSPFITSPSELISQGKASQNLQSLSLISVIPSISNDEKRVQTPQKLKSAPRLTQKVSFFSNKSKISKKKISGLSKRSFMSDSLKRSSMFSVKRKDSSSTLIEVPALSKTFSLGAKGQRNSGALQKPVLMLSKKPLNSSLVAALSLQKQVICERDELLISEDEDEDGYEAKKILKSMMAAKELQDQEQQIQQNRIDGMINLFKQKIRSKKQSKMQNPIPQKYHAINYQQFCSLNTFLYILSMTDKFQGTKKFKFICNQLRMKKRILEDKFVEDVVKEFALLMESEKQVDEWREYILDCRGKVMFEKLNRLIDVEMLEMEKERKEGKREEERRRGLKHEEEKVNEEIQYLGDEGQESEEPKYCRIFNKIDQSQLAFERYMKKLMRKNKHPNDCPLTQISQNIPPQSKPSPQQIISQKTIDEGIETTSTKTIRYRIVDHKNSKANRRTRSELEESSLFSGTHINNRKKALQYLFKKKPQEFRQLSKNVTEVMQLFVGNTIEERNEESFSNNECLQLIA